jgi:hypothetical protein
MVNEELQLLHHAYNLAIREWEWLEINPVSAKRKTPNPLYGIGVLFSW